MFVRTASAGLAATVLLLAGLPHSAALAKPPDLPFMQKDACLEKAAALEVHSAQIETTTPASAGKSNAGSPTRREGTPILDFIDWSAGSPLEALLIVIRSLPLTID